MRGKELPQSTVTKMIGSIEEMKKAQQGEKGSDKAYILDVIEAGVYQIGGYTDEVHLYTFCHR
jgi:hypothetical protein